ncbi:MAG TPA: hypothetical protein VMW75_18755 [Thermoanaerobaculia bacterium]|nr:hypothetical protein [Thermoanaerobaculia bacterium]
MAGQKEMIQKAMSVLGKRGGRVRAGRLSDDRLSAIARKAGKARGKSQGKKRSTGGQLAIRGVGYQLLWSLIRASEVQVRNLKCDDRAWPSSATLILEPRSGADLDLELPKGRRRIEQIKSRGGGQSWRLAEMVREVLPNLYACVDFEVPAAYCFVSETGLEDSDDVLEFFLALGKRAMPERGRLLAGLDDSVELVSAPSHRHWLRKRRCTERGVFAHIATRLRRPAEPLDENLERTWRLLAGFEFQGHQVAERLEEELRVALRGVGVPEEEVEAKRDALIGDLLKRAESGERIRVREFFQQHGLDAVPLGQWGVIAERCRRYREGCLAAHGYDRRQDPRQSVTGIGLWGTTEAPADGSGKTKAEGKVGVLFWGESGAGKSWRLYRLAHEVAREGQLVVLVKASGGAASDLQTAATVFCREIWRTPFAHSLSSIAERMRELVPRLPYPWLTVLVDGVPDGRYADELLQIDWENLGARIAVAVPTADDATDSRWRKVPVGDFSLPELTTYVRAREVAVSWSDVPTGVRGLLRRPLFARLFCDSLLVEPGWRIENMYQLLEEAWQRQGRPRIVAADALAELACSLPTDPTYPWPLLRVRRAGLSDSDIAALRSAGLVRSVHGGRSLELWHDRILSWAVAEGLAAAIRAGQVEADSVVERLRPLRAPDHPLRGRLGFPELDTLWLLLRPDLGQGQATAQLLRAIEEAPRDLYLVESLATLGARVVPHLFARLAGLTEQTAEVEDLCLRYEEVLKGIDDPSVADGASMLLESSQPPLQQAAARLLIARPSPGALNRLWGLLCLLPEEDSRETAFLRIDLQGALSACAANEPAWLEAAIRRADALTQPIVALVWALAAIAETGAGAAVWRAVGARVRETLPEKDLRAAIACEGRFGGEAVAWLVEAVQTTDHFLAPAALSALGYLQPETVFPELKRARLESLHLGRSWWLPLPLAEHYDQTCEVLLQKIRTHEDPWLAARVFADRENRITSEILDVLLDALETRLGQEVLKDPPESFTLPRQALRFLARISRLDLLAGFAARRGSRLEDHLTELLLREGPNDSGCKRWDVDDGLVVLGKLGGHGLTRVANLYVATARSSLGIRDGLQLALRVADDETREQVRAVSRDPERGAQQHGAIPLVQFEAVKVLAALGERKELVRGIDRLGLKIPRRLADYLESRAFTDEELERPLAGLRSGAPSAGDLLALGLSGRTELAPALRAALERALPDSDEALACLLALEDLGDRSPEAEALFIAHLRSLRCGFVAQRALLDYVSQSARARAALLDLLRHLEQLENGARHLLVANLLLLESTRKAAAEILWSELAEHQLLFYAGDTIEHLAVLGDPRLRELLHETATSSDHGVWFGDKVAAMRGLATFDAEAAFEAADDLMSERGHERELCPGLLLDLDRQKGIGCIAAKVRRSDDLLLLAAVGEALDRRGMACEVLAWLASADERLREGAALVAQSMGWSQEVETQLRDRLRDQAPRVREAAVSAYEALLLARETNKLVAAVNQEQGIGRRWMLADAALEIGYPGVVPGYGGRSWFGAMCKNLSFPMQQHALERLEDKRKDLRRELDQRRRE